MSIEGFEKLQHIAEDLEVCARVQDSVRAQEGPGWPWVSAKAGSKG